MSYNSNLPVDNTADTRENFRALKEDKIVDATTAVAADSAAKLATARKISFEGDATGSTSFDGSADVAITVDVLSADNANTVEGKTVNDIIYISSPAGAVQYFAMASAPTGWLKADGSAVSRTDYANLFTAIGTMFGLGDGTTTFNLPDLRGEFVRGFDDGRGVDAGRILGSAQDHLAKLAYPYGDFGDGFAESFTNNLTPSVAVSDDQVSKSGLASIISSSNTAATETRPRNISLLACIKY